MKFEKFLIETMGGIDMNNYKTPEFNVMRFDINGKIMDGDKDGDINENPWGELLTDQASESESNI